MDNFDSLREIDSTEKPLPMDITQKELEIDQCREISEEEKKHSEEILEEYKRENNL